MVRKANPGASTGKKGTRSTSRKKANASRPSSPQRRGNRPKTNYSPAVSRSSSGGGLQSRRDYASEERSRSPSPPMARTRQGSRISRVERRYSPSPSRSRSLRSKHRSPSSPQADVSRHRSPSSPQADVSRHRSPSIPQADVSRHRSPSSPQAGASSMLGMRSPSVYHDSIGGGFGLTYPVDSMIHIRNRRSQNNDTGYNVRRSTPPPLQLTMPEQRLRRKGENNSTTNSAAVANNHSDENLHQRHLGLQGDYLNIALLLLLYILQGIPLGLAGSIPLLLQSRAVSYKDQAFFSFVYWPFSLKLLWAPIVDSCYSSRMGRRKSWLVPTQYLIGTFMFFLSTHADEILGDSGSAVNILSLTVLFFSLNFLAATQDIAVDGWALTMLQRRNVGWASTCNSIGQTAGYFMGNVVFLALESADFCNSYLRSEPAARGVVTLPGFLQFWAIIFFITTTLVLFFKHERPLQSPPGEAGEIVDETDDDKSVMETYKTLFHILKLPAIQSLIVILLTAKIAFAAADAVTGLKLIEEGVPKEKLALIGIPMVPIQILLPLVISRYTSGPRPLDIYVKAIPFRMVMGLVFMMLVYSTPSFKTSAGEFPVHYFLIILVVYALHQVTTFSMFVGQMAFYAKISDPAIGGTYMTLLNTVSNLGGNWPSTVALWLVDPLTSTSCLGGNVAMSCDSADQSQACTAAGGTCKTTLDGYYIESILCFAFGIFWMIWRSRTVMNLQRLSSRAWSPTSSGKPH